MARDSVAARRKPARGDPSCVDGFTLHGDCSIGRVGVKAKGEPCSLAVGLSELWGDGEEPQVLPCRRHNAGQWLK